MSSLEVVLIAARYLGVVCVCVFVDVFVDVFVYLSQRGVVCWVTVEQFKGFLN